MKWYKIVTIIGMIIYTVLWFVSFPLDTQFYLDLGLIPIIYFVWIGEGIVIFFAYMYILSWDKQEDSEDGME